MPKKVFSFLLALGFLVLVPIAGLTAESPPACAEGDVDCLIERLNGKDAPAAMRAAMALGNLKAKKAVPHLLKKLESKDQYMATASLHALVKIGEAAVPELVEATTHKQAQVRKYAGYALGRIGRGKAVKAVSRLVRDEDPEVRKRAARAFGMLKDESALFDLLNLLNDRHRSVRLEAIRALSTMPNIKIVPHVIERGVSDLDSRVSMEAAALILKVGPEAIPAVIQGIQRHPPYIRKRLAAVLGELGAKADPAMKTQAQITLLNLAKNQAEPFEVRQAACVGLGSVGGPDAPAVLEEIIRKYKGKTDAQPLVKAAKNALDRIQSQKK